MPKSNRELFIEFVEKEASSGAITDDQLKGIFQTAHQKYKLTPTIADKALKDEGFIADDGVNYFDELEFTIETLENQDEATITERVADAHLPRFSRALSTHTDAGIKTRDLLNRAKNILTDPKKRRRHIDWLNRGIIYRFSDGDVATSIRELVTLMKKHTKEATDALYRNNIAQSLDRAGEESFTNAARAVVKQFAKDRDTGLMVMLAILLGKVEMRRGGEAGTPRELARLIDQNWDEAKSLLYNGFFAFYLEYTNQRQLAKAAKDVTRDNPSRKDIGLEEFVQKLDSRIGHPEPEVSHPKIDFGSMDTESQKTVDIQITNVGRGFLYGDVQLSTDMPGLQVLGTEIQGGGVVSVKLDASQLTPNKMYQTVLVFNTNGGMMRVPVSCNIIEDINKRDKDGNTPLHHAAQKGAHQIAEVLIKKGADINLKNNNGETPLYDAAWNNAHQTAEVLLKKGADINLKNNNGRTPLHDAAWNNAHQTAEVLIKKGADVNAQNANGETPLHDAAWRNASDTAEILLKNGADVKPKDRYGRTALRIAEEYNMDNMVALLRKYGARKGWFR